MSLRQFVALMAGMVLAVAAAQAQTSVRVRGTITALDGNVLSVKSREGRDLKITLADNVAVSVAKAIRFEDIKPGRQARRDDRCPVRTACRWQSRCITFRRAFRRARARGIFSPDRR